MTESKDNNQHLIAGAIIILAIAIIVSVNLYRASSPFERCVKEQMKAYPYQKEANAIILCKSLAN